MRLAARRAAWLVAAATMATLTVSSRARSQDDAALARSNARFEEAKRLQAEGRIAEACERFADSYRLAARGGTLLNLGLCHAREGRLLVARRELSDALATATRDGRTDRTVLARDELTALEKRLGWISVTPPGDVEVDIRVDGALIARSDWNAIAVERGSHSVQVSAPGRQPRSVRVELPQEGVSLVVVVPALEVVTGSVSPPAPPAPSVRGAPAASAPNATLRTIALVVGVVGLAAGVGFGLGAVERHGVVRSACDADRRCTEDGLRAAETGQTLAVASTAAVALGGLGVGAWLLLPGGALNPGHVAPVGAGLALGSSF